MTTLKQLLHAAGLLLLSTTIQAQDAGSNEQGSVPDSELKVFQNWSVRCVDSQDNAEKSCLLFNRIVLGNGQTLLFFQVRQASRSAETGNQDMVAVITVPLGVHLPSGMRVQIDNGEPFDLVFERCDQGGCYAGFPMDETMTNALKKGSDCKIYFNNLGGKTITATVSLKGFTAGYNAL